jgi:hypothetical protein
MARDITVTFDDGSSHVYKGAPDDITPTAVQARAEKDFGKTVTALDGGKKSAPAAPPAPAPAPAATSTAAQNQAEAQARQDIASKGPEQISIPQAELASAEANVASLRRELERKGVVVGERPAIGSTKAGDFLLAKGAEAQSQRPAPAAAVVPPAPAVTPALASKPIDDRVRRTPSLYDVKAAPPKLDNTVAGTQAALNMAGVSPQYVASLKTEFYRLPPAQRVTALQQAIAANPANTVKGRAVRAVAAEDEAWKAATSRTSSARLLGPRLEDIAANIQAKYPERPAEIVLLDAQRAIEQGRSTIDYPVMQRDVVGEQADAAVAEQAKELKDAGLSKRVGAGVVSSVTKSVAGVGQFLADITGDEEFSRELANTQRIEGAKAAAIPQGKSIFDRSFQGAATSLATQAPFLVLSALTGSPAPVLAQVGLTSFGKFYGEGRATGLNTAKSATRATAMTAAEIVFERLGMTKALAGLKEFVAKNGAENVYKYVGKAIATELPTEMATTVSQYGIDVLPSVGLNKKPSLLDLYQQVEETLRQTVLQAGATAGVTVAAVKGVQGAKATPQALAEARERLRETSNQIVGIKKTNELLGLREGAYERPKGMNEAIMQANNKRVPFASTSGALNVPPVEKAVAEPKLGDLENVGMREEEEPGLGDLENVQAGTEPSMAKGEAAPTAEDTEAKVNAIAERLRSRGIPRENALRIAQKQVAEETARTQGAEDVAGTEPTPSGESVSVAGEPGAETPGGLETPARDGVVPTTTDAGLPATGEVSEPAALVETPKPTTPPAPVEETDKNKISLADSRKKEAELFQTLNKLEEEKQSLLTKDGRKPNIKSPNRARWDALGNEIANAQTTWYSLSLKNDAQEINAGLEELTTLANELNIVNGAGKTYTKESLENILDTNRKNTNVSKIDYIKQNIQSVKDKIAQLSEQEKPNGTETVEAKQAEAQEQKAPAAVGFRSLGEGEKGINWISSKEILDLGNGNKVQFSNNGDGHIGNKDNADISVIRLRGDTRGGVTNKLSNFPDFVPEPLRQPLLDYSKALEDNYYDRNEKSKAAADAARAKLEQAAAALNPKVEAKVETKTEAPTEQDKAYADIEAELAALGKDVSDLLKYFDKQIDDLDAVKAEAKVETEAKAKAAEAQAEKDEEAREEALREKAEAEIDAGPIGEALRRIEDGDRVETKAQLRPFMFKLEKNGVLDDISDIQEALSDREQTADDVLDMMRDQLETARDDAVDERIDELREEAEQEAEVAAEAKAKAETEAKAKTEAPAAPKPPKVAKPGKEVHTTPQNAEGKWSHAINGEVVKTYDTKTQAIAAMLLNKAQKTGNEELIAKRQKIFDGAMNPQQRGRPPKLVDTITEDTEEAETAKAKAAVEKANADAKAKAEADDKAVEEKEKAYEANKAKAEGIARTNARAAFSQVGDYDGNIDASVDSYRQNTYDTLNEEGLRKDPRYDRLSDAADRAFDAEVAKLKAEAAAKAKPKPNLTAEEKERLEELDDIHRNATNNPNTEGGKAAKKTLERVTKDTDEPKVVRERAKAMLAGEYSAPADDEFFIQAAEGKKDLAFSKFTTSSQTLSHIIKTGTDFQKELARRLRSTVRNVKMVVVEKGQELPASVAAVKAKWDRALAMYNTEEKVVYTKGESYGRTNGLNAVVQLHELSHGATSQKIRTALAYMKMGRHVDSQMVKAVDGLQKTMDAARAELNKQIENGTADSDVHSLAVYGEAFTNLHEFVSYGNTDAKLQEFLKGVKGFEKNSNLFSPFVDALRRIIGMGKEDATALSDLIQHTDQLISSRRPGGWGFPEVGTLASAAIPPPPGERTQEEMDADDAAAWDKVDRTQIGQKRADALSSFMALRDPRVIWARLEGVWDKIDDPTRKAIALFFDRNGIANTIGKHIPVLYDIADRLQKMDGMAASLRGEAAKQAGMVVNFARKDRKAMEVLNRLIPASTIAGYDPANPPASGVRAVKTDEAYEALKPAGQRVYREVRDYFADMYNAARDIMEASVDSLDLPADARQKLMASIRLAFEEGKIEPYFPLMRYGDYIFRIKERGSDKYESYRFETKTERNFAAKAYAKEQGVKLKDLVENNEVDLAEDDGGKEQRGIVESSKLLKEMYEAIDSMDTTDANAKAKLKDNMYQVYLDLMPEASMRKQFIHREGTVGFGTDTLRMINTQGIKIASALSKLQYGNEIRNLSEQANRQLKGKEQYKAFVGAMDSVIDEALNPKPLGPVAGFFNPVAQQWTKFTFFHNLTSLSSALMQPADILLTGAPVLVGNHGPKAMVELTKMANVVKQFGVWETLPDGTERFRAPSIAYAKGLPQVELDAIADMVGAYGLSSDTLANEIFDAATKPVDKADPKAVEFAKNAGKLLVFGGLMHHTERISREVIGAVSFRLHYAEMEKASPGDPTNYANAVRAAVAEANEALGDYSPGNRPQIMRGPIGKLLSTYKFFPLTRIKLLGGNFFRMIPFLNKEGKIAAATKFFGILGTHSILTGVVGLPMYGLIQALWGQWQKDEDAPQTMKDLDHDTWWRTEFLRAELGDGQFTKFAKEIAKSGIANYATGMAISERLGLNDMVFRTPSPGKNLKESVANYAEAFFGAQLTPIKATQDSWDYYSQGEYQKMFESLPFMPKSISALSATERVSREGIETKQGIPILDKGEVTTKELIGQALGFQSARVAEARRIAYATDLIERGIGTEKQAIVGKAATMFLKAINPNRDPEDRQRFLNMYLETVQKIPKFNIKYPEYGIDGKEIDAKIDAELEKIAASKMFGGVKINDNNLRLFIQAALASREALNNPK